MSKGGYIYIMANAKRGTTYVGVTADLAARVWQHRNGIGSAFTARHGARRLVHYEVFDDIATAIRREKELKKWRRQWKLNLIERDNPDWNDRFSEVALG